MALVILQSADKMVLRILTKVNFQFIFHFAKVIDIVMNLSHLPSYTWHLLGATFSIAKTKCVVLIQTKSMFQEMLLNIQALFVLSHCINNLHATKLYNLHILSF